MTISDDFIIDCREVSSVESIARETFTIDLCADGCTPGNSETEFVDWSGPIGNMDVDLPSPGSFQDARILGYPLSSKIEPVHSRKEFECDLLSVDPDSDGESAARPQAALSARSARPSACLTSALLHFSFFFFAFFPANQVAGTPGYTGNVLSATVVSHEDLIPQNESPGSIDSAASAPSIAKKSPNAMELHPSEPHKEPVEIHECGTEPVKIPTMEEQQAPDRPNDKKEHVKEERDGKEDPRAQGIVDSAASMPSTASAPRQFIPAAGQEGESFEAMVLSAIRQAIFFPKQALQARHHGEVKVRFVIGQDGSLLGLSVAKSSGSTVLDEAAVKIIQKGATKFPPIPESLQSQSVEYVVPIFFKEKGS